MIILFPDNDLNPKQLAAGQTVTFSQPPNGDYAKANVPYTVIPVDNGLWIRFENANTGTSTIMRPWWLNDGYSAWTHSQTNTNQ